MLNGEEKGNRNQNCMTPHLTVKPTISVIMSVYNGELFLREALESVLNQSFQNFELIIIDDGSTDASVEILQSFSDERIRLIRQENIGLTKSLNKAIKMATGDYIARQDADDVSERNRFEKQVEVLDESPNVVLVSSLLRYISATGEGRTVTNRDFEPALIKWLLLFFNHIGGHSQVMYRREVAELLGGYNESYKYSQDYDLWLRFSEVGDIIVLPEILLNWRFHANNISFVSANEQREFSLKTSARYIEKYSEQIVSEDDVRLLRNFWIQKDTTFSRGEILKVDELLSGILKGLKASAMVTAETQRQISLLVSKFFSLNTTCASRSGDQRLFKWLAFKWWAKSGFRKNDRIDAQTEKIR